MAIPQNFKRVEQRILAVTAVSANVQFTVAAPAGQGTYDLLIENTGTKACQLALGQSSTLTALQDASAGGTTQIKIPAGVVMMIRKDADNWAAAICEGSDTTTLYLHAGIGT